jgi:hypothetical protein
MTILSLVISLVSLAIATAMAIVVARMRREERGRSDARVEALSRMAEADFLPEPDPFPTSTPTLVETSSGLFAEPDPASPWGPRLAIGGAMAVVLLVVVVVSLLRAPAAPATAAGIEAQAVAAPLELIALEHRQDQGSLTVSGRVRNSRSGQPVSSLTATVFLFGSDGAFMTSGRSPLDVPVLDAGGESAFVVVIPVNGAVTRYRISFRDAAGHAVAHVDRRNTASLARNE